MRRGTGVEGDERVRTSYGYDTYRGRTKLQTALTVLIVILVVVLLLAVAAFFLLQKYMVYTDDGRAKLELPFLREETPSPTPTREQELVIVTPEPAVTSTPEPTLQSGMAPVALLRSAISDGSAREQAAALGGDAVLFNMKAGDGSLGYVSSLSQAISAKTSAADPELNAAIQALTSSELYTIARVSCFKDDAAPKADGALAIRTNSNYKWRDAEDLRWMNPTVPAAREYVTGVCVELAALGFDEILLDDSAWPTQGHLEYIKIGEAYAPDHLTETVETFYQEVRTALADTGVILSITVNAAALSDEGDRSGQTAQLLGRYADRVYVLGAEKAGVCDEALTGAGLSEGTIVYVDPSVGLTGSGKRITFS